MSNFCRNVYFCIDIDEDNSEPSQAVQGPVPLPELTDLLQDAKEKGKLTDSYIEFIKHHGDHLRSFYPRPSKATLDLYGKLIVEMYPEFKDSIRSTKKIVMPWVRHFP